MCKKISAVFEFSRHGNLKAIFLNADNDWDHLILERCLKKLVNPNHSSWLRKLIRK